MKVIIFNKNTLKDTFNNYGYGKLRYIRSCKIIEELNGRYEAEVLVGLEDTKSKYLTKWGILWINGQLFRIYNTVTNDKENTIKAYARHIFYDINYGFIEDTKVEDKTITEALQRGLPTDFTNFTVLQSDITSKRNIYYVKDTGVEAIFRTIERWGVGELVRDNFNFGVMLSKGKDRGVTFTYKKVDEIELTHNVDEVVTRLYPTGKDNLKLAERFITIPNWNTVDYPPFHITREVNFSECESEGELRELATQEAQRIGLSSTNFKINVNNLLKIEEYKHLTELMTVEVGDTITIKHSVLDVRVKVKVIKKDIDLATNEVTLELGQPLDNFFKSVDNNNVKVDIPSFVEYVDGMFYYSNGMGLNLNPSIETDLAFLNFSVQENSNLMLYFTAVVKSVATTDLTLKILVDNREMLLKPTQTVGVGSYIVSFSYPLISMSNNSSHSLSIKGLSNSLMTIDKEQLQIVIKGQNTMGGLNSEPPHFEQVEIIPYTDVLLNNIVTSVKIITEEVSKVAVSENISYVNVFTGVKPIGVNYTITLGEVAQATSLNNSSNDTTNDNIEIDTTDTNN